MGSGHPVSVQSMTKTRTSDIEGTIDQIRSLENAGCEIARVAVKDPADAKAISAIKQEITIPLVADIHFDYRLAVEAAKQGVDKIRLNPGNICDKGDIDKVIDAAGSHNIPIRIGVNSGSLVKSENVRRDLADTMVKSALKYIEHFKKRGFEDLVISLKASEVPTTVKAYRKIASECDYPLHLGITAAGLPEQGMIKSSIGLGVLLMEGVGDTIRVSLTGDPVAEVEAAKLILSAVGIRHFGPRIVACPTCGRCQVDLVGIVSRLEEELKPITRHALPVTDRQLVIAIMGCEVNGPGEAKDADIGIAFGKGKGAIFRQGKIIKTVNVDDSVNELMKIIREEM